MVELPWQRREEQAEGRGGDCSSGASMQAEGQEVMTPGHLRAALELVGHHGTPQVPLCTEPQTAPAYRELVPVDSSSSPKIIDILQGT